MELQKLNVKFFVDKPSHIPLSDFIEIFHGWIQVTDGVFHDVADYSHMQAGPGIVLVAGDANVCVDETNNRRGLLFSQKRPLAGSNEEKLRWTVRAALENCRKLESEPGLKGKLRFSASEAEISVNDRLVAENTSAAFSALKDEVEILAGKLFAGAPTSLQRDEDRRQRLNLRIKSSTALNIEQALINLQRN